MVAPTEAVQGRPELLFQQQSGGKIPVTASQAIGIEAAFPYVEP
jgi:hypothetical protein